MEITENVVIADSARALSVLNALKELGVRVALDDFGTGYSALSYLSHLPIDIVKIDRHFIADIDRAPKGRALVEAITVLAHALDLSVTAEGVETRSQREYITAIGCELAQGFYFARPIPAGEVTAWVTDPAHLPARDRPLPALLSPRRDGEVDR
jgi:EAL domain-containing protein (putative c-di-GMP-specific phosphodiesterase class I)